MRWLVDCRAVGLSLDLHEVQPATGDAPPLHTLSPDQFVSDPLLPVHERFQISYVYQEMGFAFVPDTMLARREVLRRLRSAETRLPPNFGFVVLDGWRSRRFQEELYAYYQAATPGCEEYVADPESARTAPHLTGGALDLTLAWHGIALGLGTDYDEFSPRAAIDSYHRDPDNLLIKNLRTLLRTVLEDAGFVSDPLEWWHWSFGDDWWATQRNIPAALYREVQGPFDKPLPPTL